MGEPGAPYAGADHQGAIPTAMPNTTSEVLRIASQSFPQVVGQKAIVEYSFCVSTRVPVGRPTPASYPRPTEASNRRVE